MCFISIWNILCPDFLIGQKKKKPILLIQINKNKINIFIILTIFWKKSMTLCTVTWYHINSKKVFGSINGAYTILILF